MIKLFILREPFIGDDTERDFGNYSDMRDFMDIKLNEYKANGWHIYESPLSSHFRGLISLEHLKSRNKVNFYWESDNSQEISP